MTRHVSGNNNIASSCIYKNALFLKICHQHSPFISTRLNSFKINVSIMYVNADIIWAYFVETSPNFTVYHIFSNSFRSYFSKTLIHLKDINDLSRVYNINRLKVSFMFAIKLIFLANSFFIKFHPWFNA